MFCFDSIYHVASIGIYCDGLARRNLLAGNAAC
jgi:hypothetical protein